MLAPLCERVTRLEQALGVQPVYRGSSSSYYNLCTRLDGVAHAATYRSAGNPYLNDASVAELALPPEIMRAQKQAEREVAAAGAAADNPIANMIAAAQRVLDSEAMTSLSSTVQAMISNFFNQNTRPLLLHEVVTLSNGTQGDIIEIQDDSVAVEANDNVVLYKLRGDDGDEVQQPRSELTPVKPVYFGGPYYISGKRKIEFVGTMADQYQVVVQLEDGALVIVSVEKGFYKRSTEGTFYSQSIPNNKAARALQEGNGKL